jgi:hypothetical protein
MIRGVRKNNSSCELTVTLVLLKRLPMSGKLPTSGT